MKSLRTLLLLLPLLAVPSYSQVIANASLAADTGGEQAPLVTLGGNGTAVSVGVTSTGMLACTTTYPVITFYVHRNSSNLSLAVITTSNSTSWSTNNVSFNGLLAADQVFAEITTAGVGCSNDVPLGVNFHYIPSAATNICQASPSPCATLVGVLAGANGINAQDDILSFQPNQWFFVAGTSGSGSSGIVVNSPTYCGTSINGMVVGVPDPLAQPSMSALMSGSLPAGTYFVEYSFYDYAGNETLASPELSIVLGSTGGIQVNPPGALPSGVAGMRIYISATSGTETFQGYTNGNAAYHQTTAITSGAQPLSSNTTLCKVVANDAGWPTGTGYTTSLSDQEGNTFPGYPMMWQILGANTTINLSNGVPYYHGVVTFPSPVLASPLNQATQSVNGSLSLGPFTLYAQRAYLGWYGPSGPVAGETDYIAGTLLANVPTGIVATAAPVAAQPLRLVWPSSGPGTDGNALVQTSHDAFGNVFLGWGTGGGGSTGVSLEYEYPLDLTNAPSPTQSTDLIRTLFQQAEDTDFAGPLPPSDPRSAVVQDKMCTIGDTPTCSGGGGTITCAVSTSPTSFAHCSYSIDQPILPGDTGYVEFTAEPGLGGSGIVNSMSDTQANTWTQVVNDDGSGSTLPSASYWTHLLAGPDTISVNFDTSAGFQFRGVFHFVELRGTVTPDGNGFNSGSGFPFQAITTVNNTDTILGDQFIYGAGCTYFPGTNFGLLNEFNGTVFTNNVSIGGESRNVASASSYTPSITASGSGCSGTTGASFTQAFTQAVYAGPAKPTFRLKKYIDLVAGLDFPSQVGQGGNCLAASGEDYEPLVWASCGSSGVTSIQFKNSGTNFGSPMTGVASLNFSGCTVSGTAPNFTVTCSGSGVSSLTGDGVLFDNSASTGAVTLHQKTFSADNIYGNFTGGTATPSTQALPSCAADGAHALTYPSHTLTCTSIGGGTIGGSGTTGFLPKFTASTTLGNSAADDGITTANTFTYSGTGGITASAGGISSQSDGTHAARLTAVGNTTLPSLPSNTFNVIGPNSASFTAFGWQFPTAENSTAGMPYIGAASSHVSAVSIITQTGSKCYPFMGSGGTGCDTPSGTGTVTTTGSPASPDLSCFSGSTSITNCNLSGDATTSNSAVVSLAAPFKTRECEVVWGGSGTSFALTSGDDAIANQSCLNTLGVTETITAVQCRSDVGSNTTTVNPTFGSTGTGTTICSGALTCGNSGAYSSTCTVSNPSLTSGSNINPVMGGTLTGTSIHMVVTYSVPN